jgi:hypothetical protein
MAVQQYRLKIDFITESKWGRANVLTLHYFIDPFFQQFLESNVSLYFRLILTL